MKIKEFKTEIEGQLTLEKLLNFLKSNPDEIFPRADEEGRIVHELRVFQERFLRSH